MNLAEAAAQRLVAPLRIAPLERLWAEAALRTLASSRPQDPDRMALRSLTEPVQVWTGSRQMDAETLQDRIGRLRDCHLLAIAVGDVEWLRILADCWVGAPEIIGPWWPLRARGEIALRLGTDAVWDAEEIEALKEECIVCPDAPADYAWLALVGGDKAAAGQALIQYEVRLSKAMHAWRQDPQAGLRQALAYPGTVLRTELRALQLLVGHC